jgi:tetratricopeptide (TPR) repeat protein
MNNKRRFLLVVVSLGTIGGLVGYGSDGLSLRDLLDVANTVLRLDIGSLPSLFFLAFITLLVTIMYGGTKRRLVKLTRTLLVLLVVWLNLRYREQDFFFALAALNILLLLFIPCIFFIVRKLLVNISFRLWTNVIAWVERHLSRPIGFVQRPVGAELCTVLSYSLGVIFLWPLSLISTAIQERVGPATDIVFATPVVTTFNDGGPFERVVMRYGPVSKFLDLSLHDLESEFKEAERLLLLKRLPLWEEVQTDEQIRSVLVRHKANLLIFGRAIKTAKDIHFELEYQLNPTVSIEREPPSLWVSGTARAEPKEIKHLITLSVEHRKRGRKIFMRSREMAKRMAQAAFFFSGLVSLSKGELTEAQKDFELAVTRVNQALAEVEDELRGRVMDSDRSDVLADRRELRNLQTRTLYFRGLSRYFRGDYRGAVEDFQEVSSAALRVDGEPLVADALYNLGYINYRHQRELAKAASYLRRSLQYRPEFVDAHLVLAMVEDALGASIKDTWAILERGEKSATSVEDRLKIATVARVIGHTGFASQVLQTAYKLANDEPDPQIDTLLALALQLTGDDFSARELFSRALLRLGQLDEPRSALRLSLGFEGLGDVGRAEKCLRHTFDLLEKQPEPGTYIEFASQRKQDRRAEWALDQAEGLIRTKPNLGAYLELAHAYYSIGKGSKAQDALTVAKASLSDQDHPGNYLLLAYGYLYIHQRGRAVDLCDKVLQEYADELSPQALIALGYIYKSADRLASARLMYDRAFRKMGNEASPRQLVELGNRYGGIENASGAVAAYEQAMRPNADGLDYWSLINMARGYEGIGRIRKSQQVIELIAERLARKPNIGGYLALVVPAFAVDRNAVAALTCERVIQSAIFASSIENVISAGNACAQIGQTGKATAAYRAASLLLEKDPSVKYYSHLVSPYFQRFELRDEGLLLMDQILQHLHDKLTATDLRELAGRSRELGDNARAVDLADRMVALVGARSSPLLYIDAGNIYRRAGDNARAEKAYRAALRAVPLRPSAEPLILLGEAFDLVAKHREAYECFAAALKHLRAYPSSSNYIRLADNLWTHIYVHQSNKGEEKRLLSDVLSEARHLLAANPDYELYLRILQTDLGEVDPAGWLFSYKQAASMVAEDPNAWRVRQLCERYSRWDSIPEKIAQRSRTLCVNACDGVADFLINEPSWKGYIDLAHGYRFVEEEDRSLQAFEQAERLVDMDPYWPGYLKVAEELAQAGIGLERASRVLAKAKMLLAADPRANRVEEYLGYLQSRD